MSLTALREGLGLLAGHPALWVTGLLSGALGGAYLLLVLEAGFFIGSRATILFAVIIPFLCAGFYSQVCNADFTLQGFISGAVKGYFRILLPVVILAFAALVTVGLVLVPVTLIGIPADPVMISGVFLGVCVPFAFFSFFCDTAALCEGQKVFASIRRSAQVVVLHGWKTFAYYVESLLLVFIVSFLGLIMWTSLLMDRLEPIAAINVTDPAQMLTLADFQGILGQDGILVTAAVGCVLLLVLIPILLAWKVAFYRELSGITPQEAVVQDGVYDEKGRWFKY